VAEAQTAHHIEAENGAKQQQHAANGDIFVEAISEEDDYI
jgi:hypothetical protein